MKEEKEENEMRKMIMVIICLGLLFSIASLFTAGTLAQGEDESTLSIGMPTLYEETFLLWVGSPSQDLWAMVYDYLFYRDTDTKDIIPGLAKEIWQVSEDLMTYTIQLREGIPWQDGWGEVTAEDVKYTFDRSKKPGSTNSEREVLEKAIDYIEVVDDYTVSFHLKNPDPKFWHFLVADISGWNLPIVCKNYILEVGEKKAGEEPIGSGPYRVVEHGWGDYFKFEAKTEHWRVVPEFKYVIMRVVPEESTRVAMLKTGALDIAEISLRSVADVNKTEGTAAESWPGGYVMYVSFGGMLTPLDERYEEGYHRTDPWADVRVREAMNLAINREDLVKVIYKNMADPMPIGWTLPGYEELDPIPYDPDRAKELLSEAGYPDGFSLTLNAHESPPAVEIPIVQELLASYFGEIGLQAKVSMTDKAKAREYMRAAKDVGMLIPQETGVRRNWEVKFPGSYLPGAAKNHFQSEELTALYNRVVEEVDIEKREKIWAEIAKYNRKNFTEIPLVVAHPIFGFRTDKVGEWPKNSPFPKYFEYIRRAEPLGNWRLFTP